MKKSRFTKAQIINALKECNCSISLANISRDLLSLTMDVRRLIILLFMGIPFLGNADIRPQDLKITLEQLPVLEHQSDIFPLQVKITNVSSHEGSILIPYSQNWGKSLLTLLIYEIDSNKEYKLVYTSPNELNMDTSKYKTEGSFWHLKQGEHFILPLFLNDSMNKKRRFESSFQIPELKHGKNYAFQVLYTPENSSFFKYAFREISTLDPIPEDDVKNYPNHFIWEGSFASNFLYLPFEKLLKKVVLQPKSSPLCNAIYKQNWRKVKRLWDDRHKEKSCDCILWVNGGAQSIQASLPAYTGYDVMFYTDSGIKYVTFTYQLGKIYHFRSRVAWLFYATGFRQPPFKTSKVNWSKLIRLYVWE